MLSEFKKFIMKGNVLDLAVAVIIGGAFGGIVKSLVDDILMPPIGMLLGRVNFSDLYINISGGTYASLADAQNAGAVTVNYGLFINTIINFLFVALAVFFVVKSANALKPKETPAAPAEPTTKTCPYCITEISIKATRCPNCTSTLDAG